MDAGPDGLQAPLLRLVLGYAWTLVRPFAFFGVIYVVFAEIADLGDGVTNYPASTSLWRWCCSSSSRRSRHCLSSLVDAREPAAQDPLSAARDPAVGRARRAVRTSARRSWPCSSSRSPAASYPAGAGSADPAAGAALTLLALGLGLLLSVLYVRYRDMQADLGGRRPDAVLRVARPLCGDDGPRGVPAPYLANPIATVLTQMRHAVVDDGAPTREPIGGAPRLLIPLGIVAVGSALGAVGVRPRGAAGRREPMTGADAPHATDERRARGAARAGRDAGGASARRAPRAPTAAVAAAQDRVYWLDRWHLDLNALMAKPGAPSSRGRHARRCAAVHAPARAAEAPSRSDELASRSSSPSRTGRATCASCSPPSRARAPTRCSSSTRGSPRRLAGDRARRRRDGARDRAGRVRPRPHPQPRRRAHVRRTSSASSPRTRRPCPAGWPPTARRSRSTSASAPRSGRTCRGRTRRR